MASDHGRDAAQAIARWRRPALLIYPLVMLGFCCQPLVAQASPATATVTHQVLSETRYQTSLPTASMAGPSGFGNSSRRSANGNDQGQGDRTTDGDGAGSADKGAGPGQMRPDVPEASQPPSSVTASAITRSILGLLPPLLLLALVMGLIYVGVRAFQNRRRATAPAQAVPAMPATRPSTLEAIATVAPQLPTWQVLANQGRFTEAIHLLLLQLLRDMRHQNAVDLTASLTSREILQTSNLPSDRRSGLAIVIGAVEFCHFGGRAAGLQLYERCLAAYHLVTTTPPPHAATE
ncbi:MAG TPA: hypothetical protein VF920_09385 [Dongiaceae bacterium]